MLGFQAAGSAPIVDGAPVLKPHTIATAIRIGNPASWQHALTARDESGGLIDKVTDEEILGSLSYAARAGRGFHRTGLRRADCGPEKAVCGRVFPGL